MPEKDPTTWTAATWLLALGMAFGGGAVNWYAKVKRGHTRAFLWEPPFPMPSDGTAYKWDEETQTWKAVEAQ